MSYTIEVSLYKDDEESHVLESYHRGAEDLEEAYGTYIEAVAACKVVPPPKDKEQARALAQLKLTTFLKVRTCSACAARQGFG